MSAATLFPDERTIYRRKVILTICLILAVLGAFSAIVWRWRNGVDTQNHAVRVMFVVVTDFLRKNEGRWPQSWEELEAMPSAGNWYDPINFELMKREVLIDFDVSLEQLATESPAEFQAIRPKNPVFDFSRDPRLVILLTTIQEYYQKANAP